MNFNINTEEYSDEELAILKFQIDKGLEIIEAKRSGKPMDISEQIEFISNILGINLTDLIMSMVTETEPKEDNVDQEVLSFLDSCESEVQDYETKLKALRELKDL
jgi:hypothetical protein